MAKQIWAAEISTNNLSNELREKLFNGTVPGTPVFGNKRRGLDEVFVLRTGSQFMVFGVGETVDPLLNFFLQDPELFQNVHYYRTTEASVNLMFATACGLTSTIKGGNRVLQDLQKAHYLSLKSGGLGLTLDVLIRQALTVGKRVRTTTGLETVGSNVFDSTLESVLNSVALLKDPSILVIGEGDVARNALDFFHKEGVSNVIVATKNSDHAKEFEKEYGVSAIHLDEITPFFHLADLVINDESSELSFNKDLFKFRGNSNSKVMLDFAFSSEFHKKLQASPLITLYTLEDMQHSPIENANLFQAVEEAWKLVEDEAKSFLPRLNQLHHAPALALCWSDIVKKGSDGISLLLHGSTSDHMDYERLIGMYNQILLKIKNKEAFGKEFISDHRSEPAEALAPEFIHTKTLARFCKNRLN